MTGLKQTPLFPVYANYPGVRCIDFGGWQLPVQFSGIQKEHNAVRTRAGLFDVSHMGEFLLSGKPALSFLQRMTTNDVSRLVDGQAQYSFMCCEDGGVIDDLLVYRLNEEKYMLVVNASNMEKDWLWLQQHLPPGISLENCSDETALLALQGPLACGILSRLTDADLNNLRPFHFLRGAQLAGSTALISRTGYTGEDGFELYVRADEAIRLWRALMAAGEPDGLLPAGLGARDTLRFEAKLPLYGQELSAAISPLEAGLASFVKLKKEGGFIGCDALAAQQASGIPRRLVGIELLERGIPRAHYPVFAGGVQIGEVTTGTQSPTLKRPLGLALLQAAYASPGSECQVGIRGSRLKAVVVGTPFYKRSGMP